MGVGRTYNFINYEDIRTFVLSTDFLKAGVERRKLFCLGEVKQAKTKIRRSETSQN